MIDMDKVIQPVFDRMQKAFPDTLQDPLLDTYKRMDVDDFNALSSAYGTDMTAKYILEMEKKNLGGKRNGN